MKSIAVKEEQVEFYFNKVKTVSLNALQSMYSPMFDKNFSEMSDDEIKQQLDLWVEDNEHKEIFEPRKPLTKEQREKNFNNFIKNKRI